jgi:hypothetical protein
LQENLHVLKVKGHRIRLEEIVADHAREVEAKSVLSGDLRVKFASFGKLPDLKFWQISFGLLGPALPCAPFSVHIPAGFVGHNLPDHGRRLLSQFEY